MCLLKILYRIGFLQLTYQRMFDSQNYECNTISSHQSFLSDTESKAPNPLRLQLERDIEHQLLIEPEPVLNLDAAQMGLLSTMQKMTSPHQSTRLID